MSLLNIWMRFTPTYIFWRLLFLLNLFKYFWIFFFWFFILYSIEQRNLFIESIRHVVTWISAVYTWLTPFLWVNIVDVWVCFATERLHPYVVYTLQYIDADTEYFWNAAKNTLHDGEWMLSRCCFVWSFVSIGQFRWVLHKYMYIARV